MKSDKTQLKRIHKLLNELMNNITLSNAVILKTVIKNILNE